MSIRLTSIDYSPYVRRWAAFPAIARESKLTFLALAHVGFTSVRREHCVSKLDWFLFYSGGTSHSCGDVLDNAGKITIRSYISLKLGFLGRAVGKYMTGHWPPWANLMIELSSNEE